MKILIIGAKGMLGQELVRALSQENQVFAWDREEIDITDFGGARDKIAGANPELVINAAAYNDVDGAETDQGAANLLNGQAVGNLAQVCSGLDIPLVHYSTDYVFDGTKKEGYREDDQPKPISAYGASKFLGERELAAKTEKFYLIRLSKLFGLPAASGLGKKSFVQLMLEQAENKTELDVVDEELSCPTYAVDLAAFTKYLIDEEEPFGIYHGVNEGAATWHGFARAIFEIMEIDVKLNPVPGTTFPRPAKRPRYGILLNTKIRKQRPWQEALREFLTINY